MWCHETSQFSKVSANRWGILLQKYLLNLPQIEKSRQIEFWQVRSVDHPAPLCVKLMIHYLTFGFRSVISTRQNVISWGIPIFGSFCKLLRNAVTETFSEPSENLEISSNRSLTGRQTILFLYKCQISDSLFDIGFPTFQFYLLLTCEVTSAPNFQKVLQTCEEFCNKNISAMFTTSTNNGVCKGVLTFFTCDFAAYKIGFFTFQGKVFVKQFDFPKFLVLNLDFF